MFKNMKIEITDENHLNDVCDALRSLGYKTKTNGDVESDDKLIICQKNGYFFGWWASNNWSIDYATLADLLKIRDEMVKNENP